MEAREMAEYTLTTEDVSKALGVTPGRIRQLVRDGRLTGILRTGAYFFKPEALQGYPKRQRGRPKKRTLTNA